MANTANRQNPKKQIEKIKKPLFHLLGLAPIDFLDTEIGAKEVENL